MKKNSKNNMLKWILPEIEIYSSYPEIYSLYLGMEKMNANPVSNIWVDLFQIIGGNKIAGSESMLNRVIPFLYFSIISFAPSYSSFFVVR